LVDLFELYDDARTCERQRWSKLIKHKMKLSFLTCM